MFESCTIYLLNRILVWPQLSVGRASFSYFHSIYLYASSTLNFCVISMRLLRVPPSCSAPDSVSTFGLLLVSSFVSTLSATFSNVRIVSVSLHPDLIPNHMPHACADHWDTRVSHSHRRLFVEVYIAHLGEILFYLVSF